MDDQRLTIININMQDDNGMRLPLDQVNKLLKTLSNSLEKNGLKNFLLVPHFGSLGQLSVVTPAFDNVICVLLDGNPITMSFNDFKDALNTKLREMSDTEDGKGRRSDVWLY